MQKIEDSLFRFLCPSCGKRCKAHPDYAGKEARCKFCQQKILIPEQFKRPSNNDQIENFDQFDYQYKIAGESEISSWYEWPNFMLPLIGGPLFAFVFTIIFIKASFQIRLYILIGIIIVSACVLILGLISYINQCSLAEAVNSIVRGFGKIASWIAFGIVAVLAFVVILLVTLGGNGQRTQRPLNQCNSCGYTWYPRGKNYSFKCPKCGRTR